MMASARCPRLKLPLQLVPRGTRSWGGYGQRARAVSSRMRRGRTAVVHCRKSPLARARTAAMGVRNITCSIRFTWTTLSGAECATPASIQKVSLTARYPARHGIPHGTVSLTARYYLVRYTMSCGNDGPDTIGGCSILRCSCVGDTKWKSQPTSFHAQQTQSLG